MPIRRLEIAYGLAVLLPTLAAAALIPLRVDHGATVAIILVVPVVIVAILGASGPAALAAVTAGIAYDFFLTEPYYQLVIDDPDDIVAAVTLVAVGLVVGLLKGRLVDTTARSAARRDELRHLVSFARSVTSDTGRDDLEAVASDHLIAVLGLRGCEWQPGQSDGVAPTLLPDGSIIGFVNALNPDRAKLPGVLELPAGVGTTGVGRFVLTPDPDHVTSFEERVTASTIAELFASAVGRQRGGRMPGVEPTS